jgi:hypothetical protein
VSLYPGKWTFVLARSDNMSQIGFLRNAIQKQLQLTFNRPGSLSFRIPIDDPIAYEIQNRSTCVVGYRNNVPIWSGPVVSLVDSVPDDYLSVACAGWLEELDHRYIRPSEEPNLIFAGVPGGQIVNALLDAVNKQTDGSGTARSTHLFPGVWTDTQVRSRSYKRAESYGEKIRELSDVENGCDIYVDPISRVVTCKAPTDFTVRLDTRFGYGMMPNNIDSIQRTVDGSRIANRITVVGGSGTTAGFAEDAVAIGEARNHPRRVDDSF